MRAIIVLLCVVGVNNAGRQECPSIVDKTTNTVRCINREELYDAIDKLKRETDEVLREARKG